MQRVATISQNIIWNVHILVSLSKEELTKSYAYFYSSIHYYYNYHTDIYLHL